MENGVDVSGAFLTEVNGLDSEPSSKPETPFSVRQLSKDEMISLTHDNDGSEKPDDDVNSDDVNDNEEADLDAVIEAAEIREMEYLEYCVLNKKDDVFEITGIAPTNNSGQLLLADHSNGTIKLVDRQFSIVDKFTGVFKPWGVATLDEEYFVVTFPFVRLLQYFKFKESHSKIVPWFPVKSQNEYFGVCGNKKRIITVCRYDGENMTEMPGVHIMTREGIVLHFVRKNHDGKQLFREPDHITLNNPSQLVYVSDSGIHAVVCLNLEGELISMFHAPCFVSRGIAVDQSNGKIYVNDVKSESVLRMNGELDAIEKLKAKRETLIGLLGLAYCSKTDRVILSLEHSPYLKVFVI